MIYSYAKAYNAKKRPDATSGLLCDSEFPNNRVKGFSGYKLEMIVNMT